MKIASLLRWLIGSSMRCERPVPDFKPRLESLEDRVVPAWTVSDLTTLTATALVKNLIGGGVAFSNVQYTGALNAGGIFTDTALSTGIQTGTILSAGAVKDVIGPNNSPGKTTINNTPGDPQLNAIIAPSPGLGAAVLQFDFVPKGSILSFQYVFGSEEYPEFVGSFNDVFAFFLNGKNVALVPGTNIPVSINNVSPVTNTQFYVNNFTNPAGPIFGPFDTQMDGFTKVLPVTVAVTPGQTNHIKLAIENAVDPLYDSWVLIKAGSIGSVQIHTYTPLRFDYHPSTHLYTGNVTVIDTGTVGISGQLYLLFDYLPNQVSLVNKSGLSPSGFPYIKMPGNGLTPNMVVRVFIELSDPLKVNLGTFFEHDPIEIVAKLT